MQSLIQAALVCTITACLCAAMRSLKPELVFPCAAAGALGAFAFLLPALREIVSGIAQIASAQDMQGDMARLLQACAAVIVCEIAACACRDAGQAMLAGQIELCGRVFLCALCIPVVRTLLGSLEVLLSFA